jgi:hypothetical protein
MQAEGSAASDFNPRGVVPAAGIMALAGFVFMVPVVGFPGIHANFNPDSAERLAELEAHYTNFWIGSALLSIGWLLMGIGLLLLCRRLAALETGRSATVLTVTGRVLLLPFLVLTVAYLVPQGWGLSAAEYAALADEPQAVWVTGLQAAVAAVILVGWATVSFVIARSQHWPTWLGAVFGLLGLATIVTQLPLFAALGAIVLGVTVWRRTRRGDVATAPPV